MATKEELEKLKRNWTADPCWDLETTEGFEEHRQELLDFRLDWEMVWEAQKRVRESTGGQVMQARELRDGAVTSMDHGRHEESMARSNLAIASAMIAVAEYLGQVVAQLGEGRR